MRCRERGTILVSDECYLECAWDAEPVSVLHPDVSGGSTEGILAVHSLSKRSNLAGYRCAFVVGDAGLVGELLAVRKNLGLQMPGPQQRAMIAALDDTDHAREQHARDAARRVVLRDALLAAGFRIDHSEASLYLWATRGEDCWTTVAALADLGILVGPGSFYGVAGARHVRVALTATDDDVLAAVRPHEKTRGPSPNTVQLRSHRCSLVACRVLDGRSRRPSVACRTWSRWGC